jgi:Zn ribbon nucleic-acid-binding protein
LSGGGNGMTFLEEIDCPICNEKAKLEATSEGGHTQFGDNEIKIAGSAIYRCSNSDCFHNENELEIFECICGSVDFVIKELDNFSKITIIFRCKDCGRPYQYRINLKNLEIMKKVKELERKSE